MKHYRKTKRNPMIDVYAYLFAVMFVVGERIFRCMDWFGQKLVYLIDHSDFFAGCVVTYTVITAWELLTR